MLSRLVGSLNFFVIKERSWWNDDGTCKPGKAKCIQEISENFESTDAGLIDFVKRTNSYKGKISVIFDLIELHLKDELDKHT
jgi:hypothetical protein